MGMEVEKENEGNLFGLNRMLFRELDRLEAAEGDELQAEIGRAKAIREVASTVIANGRLMVDAARESQAQGDAVRVPKGLIGG